MKTVLRLVSYAGLALTVLPPIFAFQGAIGTGTSYQLMLLGMVLWFSTAIFWIKREKTGV